jgi:hypothetical protein
MICPNCQKDQNVTENSYGALYTCKSCQAVYFINFEGQPEFSNEEIPAAIEPSSLEEAPASDLMAPLIQFNQNAFSTDPVTFENLDHASNSFSDAAKDISDYGNTETQIAHLNYDLKITGLDTAEMMRLLKEAIEDSRFGWDAHEIMRMIKRGEVQFEKLNPVKAYILAKRLQFLDVEKIWKQNAVG